MWEHVFDQELCSIIFDGIVSIEVLLKNCMAAERESPSRGSCSNNRVSFLQTSRPLRWIKTTLTS